MWFRDHQEWLVLRIEVDVPALPLLRTRRKGRRLFTLPTFLCTLYLRQGHKPGVSHLRPKQVLSICVTRHTFLPVPDDPNRQAGPGLTGEHRGRGLLDGVGG